MKILGISRSPRFSPNSTSRDAAIFDGVAEVLRRAGHTVVTCTEDDVAPNHLTDVACAYNMARDQQTLRCTLLPAEQRGLPVLNAPSALLGGSRAALAARFEGARLPVAPSIAVSLEADAALPALVAGQRYWLKRGEACAQTAGDVTPVSSASELREALADFRRRGLTEALLSAHVAGDLVKFYGVEGTPFFYHYYPTADTAAFSKFGLERFNGSPTGFAFSLAQLKTSADAAARLSGFIVYGGDAVVRADGSFLIIDFNDWPSFSRCCEDAARAIAYRLLCEAHAS